MISIEELNSEGFEIVEEKDFEVVNCVANKDNNSEISFLVKNKLAEKFKNPKYKILVYEDNKLNRKNTIILLENEEQMDYLAFNLNKSNLEFGLLRENPRANKVSKFKLNIQKWCDEFQRYLENNFWFAGITKIQAASLNNEIVTFNIIISGKGTNNEIVHIAKQISREMTDKLLKCNEDEIFTILDNYFKS